MDKNEKNEDARLEFRMPTSWRDRICLLFLAGVVVFGGCSGGLRVSEWAKDHWFPDRFFSPAPQRRWLSRVPTSKLPGPPRSRDLKFELTAEDSVLMTGIDDPENERWCDIGGKYYTRNFVSRYSNVAGKKPVSPTIRVRVKPKAHKLEGRIEVRGLKPNFAYQIKLLGDFKKDRAGYEQIGKIGRWRLPGIGTNYTDDDYKEYPEEKKHEVEAYVLFDYFVTDQSGNAIRDFSLDSSLHVLWKLHQSNSGVETGDIVAYLSDVSDPKIYARPDDRPLKMHIWAERERQRYEVANQVIQLPPHRYQAFLALTEESFHSTDIDGGWWATIAKVPITFEIIE